MTFFIVWYPFFKIFGMIGCVVPTLENLSIIWIVNYLAIVLFFLVFCTLRKRFLIVALTTFFLLFMALLANYFLTDYASAKWLLNWFGFIFVSLMIVTTLTQISTAEIVFLQDYIYRSVYIIIIFLSLLLLIVILGNFQKIINYSWPSNSTFAILTYSAGIEKQSFGNFLGLMTLIFVFSWKQHSKLYRLLFIAFLVLVMPFAPSIRTLYLGLGLCLLWLFVSQRVWRQISFFSVVILVLVAITFFTSDLLHFLDVAYDRFSSLKFAFSTLSTMPFGLGNGGYSIFVEKNNELLMKMFANELMIRRGIFWVSPESDLVYFIASWGVLSLIFFSMFVYLLLRGGLVLRTRNHLVLLPIEKILIVMSWLMIFMGISQDNAGKLLWWVFMSTGYGVLLRHMRRFKPPLSNGSNASCRRL